MDLRGLRDVGQVDQYNPRLRECVADVAAAVRELPKDELVGEHVRQHRRTVRLAQGGVTALAVLLIAAVVAAVVAVTQQRAAVTQRDLAVSRLVAGQALALRATNPALATQLALAAHRLVPNAELVAVCSALPPFPTQLD